MFAGARRLYTRTCNGGARAHTKRRKKSMEDVSPTSITKPSSVRIILTPNIVTCGAKKLNWVVHEQLTTQAFDHVSRRRLAKQGRPQGTKTWRQYIVCRTPVHHFVDVESRAASGSDCHRWGARGHTCSDPKGHQNVPGVSPASSGDGHQKHPTKRGTRTECAVFALRHPERRQIQDGTAFHQ